MSEKQSNQTIGGFLGLHALTSMHPGSGSALDTIDLPVQRERHTSWPVVSGSAVKGVLRDAARNAIADKEDDEGLMNADKHDDVTILFGPPTSDAGEHAGAMSVSDARIVAFPVRSLKGIFAWVTCPAVLERLKRDAHLAGVKASWTVPTPKPDSAVVTNSSINLADKDGHIVLEEFDFTRSNAGDAMPIAKWLAENLLPEKPEYEELRSRFEKSFIILNDDDFTHFAKHATEVTARIGLDYNTKTVRKGALFYQEFLPPECLFYTLVLLNSTRAKKKTSAQSLAESFLRQLPPVIQIGADETTGKGFCATRFVRGEV